MAQKPSERPLWFWPLVGLLAPIAIGGVFLSFQWLQWSADRENDVEMKGEKSIKTETTLRINPQQPSNPVPATVTPLVSAEPGPSGLSNSELSLYVNEIKSLKLKAEEYSEAVEGVRRIDSSGTGEGIGSGEWIKAKGIAKYQAQESHKTSLVACLENQRKLGVPFYQGKATCTAALPEPVASQDD